MAVRIVAIWLVSCLLSMDCICQKADTAVVVTTLDTAIGGLSGTDSGSYLIRSIIVKGNKVTRDAIIFREVAVKSGQTVEGRDLEKRLRLTKEQLMNTTLFVSVVVAKKVDVFGITDIEITVAERWYIFPIPYFKVVDRNWNVWINDYKASLDRTQFGLKITHNNTTGRNDKLNLWVIAGYTQQHHR
jgi:hypothetical protein